LGSGKKKGRAKRSLSPKRVQGKKGNYPCGEKKRNGRRLQEKKESYFTKPRQYRPKAREGGPLDKTGA